MKIIFWIRKAKTNKKGKAPLMCYIRINGVKSKEFSINTIVDVNAWNSKDQMIMNDSILQERVFITRNELHKIYNQLLNANENITPDIVREKYQERFKPKRFPDLLIFFNKWLEKQKQLPGLERAPRTIETYETRYNLLKKYLAGRSVTLNQIDLKFANEYTEWMKIKNKLSHNYAMKNIQILKTILNYAIDFDIISVNPLNHFRLNIKKKRAKVILDYSELKKLEDHRFTQNRLQQVADLFVFQCYTGLSYIDMKNFTYKCIYHGPEKRKWIRVNRQKTDQRVSIPLLNGAKKILEKYSYVLPVISNQRYNSYLKEIADIVGIEKSLTSHVGRKTFGTILINEHDVSLETVSRLLGHADVKTTQYHYIEIMERKIARDMANVY